MVDAKASTTMSRSSCPYPLTSRVANLFENYLLHERAISNSIPKPWQKTIGFLEGHNDLDQCFHGRSRVIRRTVAATVLGLISNSNALIINGISLIMEDLMEVSMGNHPTKVPPLRCNARRLR